MNMSPPLRLELCGMASASQVPRRRMQRRSSCDQSAAGVAASKKLIGRSGTVIVSRVMGLILASLAMDNGLRAVMALTQPG